jgi:hypothetical protein
MGAAALVQRRILGAAAIVMFLFAAAMWLWQPDVDSSLAIYWQSSLAFCWRTGAVMAAAWLAYNDVQRIPTWLLLLLPVALVLLVRSSKLLLIVLLACTFCAILWRFLTPRRGKRRG